MTTPTPSPPLSDEQIAQIEARLAVTCPGAANAGCRAAEYEATLRAKDARIVELEAALRPFGEAARLDAIALDDDEQLYGRKFCKDGQHAYHRLALSVGCLRAARSALDGGAK